MYSHDFERNLVVFDATQRKKKMRRRSQRGAQQLHKTSCDQIFVLYQY